MLFKTGFEPSTAEPRHASAVSVMPMGTAAAAKSASLFDDESDDRESDDECNKHLRGTEQCLLLRLRYLQLIYDQLILHAQRPPCCPQKSMKVYFRRSKTLMTCKRFSSGYSQKALCYQMQRPLTSFPLFEMMSHTEMVT